MQPAGASEASHFPRLRAGQVQLGTLASWTRRPGTLWVLSECAPLAEASIQHSYPPCSSGLPQPSSPCCKAMPGGTSQVAARLLLWASVASVKITVLPLFYLSALKFLWVETEFCPSLHLSIHRGAWHRAEFWDVCWVVELEAQPLVQKLLLDHLLQQEEAHPSPTRVRVSKPTPQGRHGPGRRCLQPGGLAGSQLISQILSRPALKFPVGEAPLGGAG